MLFAMFDEGSIKEKIIIRSDNKSNFTCMHFLQITIYLKVKSVSHTYIIRCELVALFKPSRKTAFNNKAFFREYAYHDYRHK